MDAAEQTGTTILLIEDDRDFRESLAELLEAEGHQVATVTNGREALVYLRAHPRPGLILLDLMMPFMNGWEFRRQQRQSPDFAHIPVFVLSGCSAHDLESLQPVTYFAKPLDLSQLLREITQLLSSASCAAPEFSEATGSR